MHVKYVIIESVVMIIGIILSSIFRVCCVFLLNKQFIPNVRYFGIDVKKVITDFIIFFK